MKEKHYEKTADRNPLPFAADQVPSCVRQAHFERQQYNQIASVETAKLVFGSLLLSLVVVVDDGINLSST